MIMGWLTAGSPELSCIQIFWAWAKLFMWPKTYKPPTVESRTGQYEFSGNSPRTSSRILLPSRSNSSAPRSIWVTPGGRTLSCSLWWFRDLGAVSVYQKQLAQKEGSSGPWWYALAENVGRKPRGGGVWLVGSLNETSEKRKGEFSP